MSTSGSWSSSGPASAARSTATDATCAPEDRSRSAAADTRSSSRPVRITRAPAAASPEAIANPIPDDEPVTNAVFPDRSIRM